MSCGCESPPPRPARRPRHRGAPPRLGSPRGPRPCRRTPGRRSRPGRRCYSIPTPWRPHRRRRGPGRSRGLWLAGGPSYVPSLRLDPEEYSGIPASRRRRPLPPRPVAMTGVGIRPGEIGDGAFGKPFDFGRTRAVRPPSASAIGRSGHVASGASTSRGTSSARRARRSRFQAESTTWRSTAHSGRPK